MPSQQNISNPQRCEFLRRFRAFQYWNNFVLQHHLNITVLNSCKSSDISNRAFPTYLLLAPAYFTFSSGLIRIRSGVFKQELACLVASVAFMFQWQLQEHALDKVRKQKGGHQLCEMHGVQELITKIHQVFSQRLQFAKNTWLLKLTRQAIVGAKFNFTLCHIWPWILLLLLCPPGSYHTFYVCCCYFLNFYFWNDAGQQALMPYLVVTTRVHALLPFQRHVPWCIAGGASVIYNMFHPVLRCSSSSADGARVLSIYQGYFPLLPCSSFHIGLWSSVLPFFVCFTKLNTFISYFYYPSPPQLPH